MFNSLLREDIYMGAELDAAMSRVMEEQPTIIYAIREHVADGGTNGLPCYL